jgi:hypothetical protein
MEDEKASKTVDYSSVLTQLVAQENCIVTVSSNWLPNRNLLINIWESASW